MRIRSESRIHHPVDRVYRAYRDRLPDIAPYIPDVREIRVIERREREDGVDLLNLWVGDADLPPVVRGVVRPDMLRWHDHAAWNDPGRYVDWRIELPAFDQQVRCEGRNRFEADGPDATRVVLSGDLEIRVDRVPGVPRALARRLAPKIEAFIVKLITPNLTRVNASLERYLDDLE